MQNSNALMAVCYVAGMLGALCNSLVAWAFGIWGVTALAGVTLAPSLTPSWLYPRLVWGGIWALAYFLLVGSPRSRRRWIRKGLLVSILPTLVQLFYVYPYTTSYGQMGLKLGLLLPLFVLLYNFIWGFCTGVFTRLLWGR